jgi:hypothetical protein
MLRKSCLALALMAAVAVGSQSAEAQGPRAMRSAVGTLLENKDSLQLSADQVARLDSLNKLTMTRNQPVMEKMRAARESGAGMEGMREFMGEMRKNDEESFQAALALLSDTQRPKAEAIVAKAREGMRRPPQERPTAPGPGRFPPPGPPL